LIFHPIDVITTICIVAMLSAGIGACSTAVPPGAYGSASYRPAVYRSIEPSPHGRDGCNKQQFPQCGGGGN
jgi:hypothetical protein